MSEGDVDPTEWVRLAYAMRVLGASIDRIYAMSREEALQIREVRRPGTTISDAYVHIEGLASQCDRQRAAVLRLKAARNEIEEPALRRDADSVPKGVEGVYVLQCETTLLWKIGKSHDVASRLRDHCVPPSEVHWLPGPVRLRRLIRCPKGVSATVEAALHWLYRDFRETRVESFELFDDTPTPDRFGAWGHVMEEFMKEAASG